MKRLIISITFFLYILNTTAAQYDDPKWEFGAEVGFAWVGFPGQGLKIDIFETTRQTTKRGNMEGFRAFVSAKYNLMGRTQFLGSIGFVKAKGEINKSKTTEGFLFGATTSSHNMIMQEFSLIEIPTYFRFYLLNERRSVKYGLNLFLDIGTSFKIPLKSDLSFSISENENPTYAGSLEVESFFGIYSAIGFSINNRATIAITLSGIRSKGKVYHHIDYRSRLKSISLTVFF